MFRTCFSLLQSSRRPITTVDVHAAYRVLGLPVGASTDSARQQYLKLARQHHPDVSSGNETKMKAINMAYEVVQSYGPELLKNQQQRQQGHPGMATTGDDGFGAPDDAAEGGGGGPSDKTTKTFKRKRARPTSMADSSSWNARPEFEWRSDIFDNINEAEAADPRHQASTFNRYFSFADDSAIFRAVRSGANVAEVARTMGRTPVAIEARMNTTQFKLRIKKLLQSGQHQKNAVQQTNEHEVDGKMTKTRGGDSGSFARRRVARQVYPHRETVYRTPEQIRQRRLQQQEGGGGEYSSSSVEEPFLYPEEMMSSSSSSPADRHNGEFSTRNIAYAEGRSYSHLKKFMNNKTGAKARW